MKIFGNKEEFAISLDLYVEKYKDHENIKEDSNKFWRAGEVYFWVKGKNLFEFENLGPDATYKYYTLHFLVDFLTDFLAFHIIDDPFPIVTKAISSDDMIQETALIKSEEDNDIRKYADLDWDEIDMEVRDKRDAWICHHGFLTNRGGTFLPNVYVRKVGNKIEVSWNNRYPHENEDGEFYFLHKKGVEYVDTKMYKDVVVQFCLAYIDHIKEKFPDDAAIYREHLQKAIDVKL